MHVVVTSEHRFIRDRSGAVYSQTMFAYGFWARYLEVFDSVQVVARVLDCDSIPFGWKRADGPNVAVRALPYYVGPIGYIRNVGKMRAASLEISRSQGAYIFRVPSVIATGVIKALPARYPFGLEVIGDPWDVFSSGAIKHPLRPLFRVYFRNRMKSHCSAASCVAYVTSNALQRRYPADAGAVSANYSSVELPDEAFVGHPRSFIGGVPSRMVLVGSLQHLYKGVDVLIDAMQIVRRVRGDVRLTIVGDGQLRMQLEERASRLGVSSVVHFCGQLSSGEAVRSELDKADLFVLPSRQEGVPRAMLEAMARAVPCIGTDVGGIPEILDLRDMVSVGNATALASKIIEVMGDLERLREMSKKNLLTVQSYRDDALQPRRKDFYHALKRKTAAWLSNA